MQSLIERNRWKWSKRRAEALARDAHRCQLRIPGICKGIATEVDHIRPRALPSGDDPDDFANLRSVCHPCHLGRGMNESGRPGSRYSYGHSRVVTRDYSA